jgi:hypothetical protein
LFTPVVEVICDNSPVLDLIRSHRDALKANSLKWIEPITIVPRAEPNQCEIPVGKFTTTGYTTGDFSFFSVSKPTPVKVHLNTHFFGH